jgi:ATP-dependent Lon protease
MSGPVAAEMANSFRLAVWIIRLLLSDKGISWEPCDYHLHLPLGQVNGSGASCRLALVHGLLVEYFPQSELAPCETVLTGDVNLAGDVLPVGHVTDKINTAFAAGFKKVVVPDAQPETTDPAVVRVRNVVDLLRFCGACGSVVGGETRANDGHQIKTNSNLE